MTKKTQRKFSKSFKFNTVLESFITGNIAATAVRHNIHITQLNDWRKIMKIQGPDMYEFRKPKKTEDELKIDQLEKIIGRITTENYILKKTEEMLN